jgi:TusA-related sulfurtransferase
MFICPDEEVVMENVQTIEFDITGQICPATLLVALREINRNIEGINAGRIRLVFKTDNRDCTNTIPEAAGNMGLRVDVHKDDSRYTILVSKD